MHKHDLIFAIAVFPCAGVGMLTPRSDWSSHMIARLITLGRLYAITIAPGKVSLFWPNKSCTKRCIHSSNPEDTGYIDTMAKTLKNYVNCVHVTLTYTSSNCILPAHG